MRTKSLKQDKVSVITLGCSKNLVDSENIITQLKSNDFEVQHDNDKDANIIIVNTCGFIDLAKEESVNTILHYSEEKNKGNIEKLYVTGCLSQRYKDDLKKEIPEVDDWFGTLDLPLLLNKFNADYKHDLIGEKITVTPDHYAYLKISEGCSRNCSFCAIPLMRGKHVSRSIEDLVREAKGLASRGVKEIMLIAQELTYYGLDIYQKRALPELLQALSELDGIEWIRLHYAYPTRFPMEIFEVMSSNDKVCNYLDIPLQHANNAVLKRMKRQTSNQEMRNLITHARDIIPDISIRSTFLVGFPGETDEEFQELCEFIREMKFERLGVFQYSHEENTGAYALEDDVSAELKMERANTIMAIQQEISLDKNAEKIGKTFKVLIDRLENDHFVGRTYADSPEVDNEVLIPAKDTYLRIGDFANIRVVDALEYDLIGTLVE